MESQGIYEFGGIRCTAFFKNKNRNKQISEVDEVFKWFRKPIIYDVQN